MSHEKYLTQARVSDPGRMPTIRKEVPPRYISTEPFRGLGSPPLSDIGEPGEFFPVEDFEEVRRNLAIHFGRRLRNQPPPEPTIDLILGWTFAMTIGGTDLDLNHFTGFTQYPPNQQGRRNLPPLALPEVVAGIHLPNRYQQIADKQEFGLPALSREAVAAIAKTPTIPEGRAARALLRRTTDYTGTALAAACDVLGNPGSLLVTIPPYDLFWHAGSMQVYTEERLAALGVRPETIVFQRPPTQRRGVKRL